MKDKYTRQWILEKGIPIVESYGGNLTIRALHYRLVAAGMTNTQRHYKRVVAAMADARWDGMLGFDAFMDHERDMEGMTKASNTDVDTEIESGKDGIKAWMEIYQKNRWENQPIYPEIFIEKKALQGVFEAPCDRNDIALCPCKGYPSLTYLHQAAERFKKAGRNGKECVILYFGDYDPSGEDIPRSIQDVLHRMDAEVDVRRIALMKPQVIKWKLPPAPTKESDSRSANWDGLGQVELDAVEPKQLQKLCLDAIATVFDEGLYEELQEQEEQEKGQYQEELKDFVRTL